jgi:hypothetical protein
MDQPTILQLNSQTKHPTHPNKTHSTHLSSDRDVERPEPVVVGDGDTTGDGGLRIRSEHSLGEHTAIEAALVIRDHGEVTPADKAG